MCIAARDRNRLCCALAALVVAGCASSPAPPAWRRSLGQAQRSPYGAYCRANLRGGRSIAGELLAVAPTGVIIDDHLRLRRVPTACVITMEVVAFEAPRSGALGWGLLGALSTISHGFILIFSAPVWLIVTPIATYGQGRAGYQRYAQGPSLLEAQPWARFPQGMPPGFFEVAPESEVLDPKCTTAAVSPGATGGQTTGGGPGMPR
jgi:hypothetical protein